MTTYAYLLFHGLFRKGNPRKVTARPVLLRGGRAARRIVGSGVRDQRPDVKSRRFGEPVVLLITLVVALLISQLLMVEDEASPLFAL
ncbi:hypothetical protein YUMDRAFT_05936 [Streptomyces sp. OspMP-M45]|nr:hypothetical protein YUMDRAFT_05936 [Streptomyces sp. OspMP-M45]